MRGPANYMSLLVNRASMTGFLVFDFADRYAEAAKEMAGWLAEGKLKTFEDVATGGIDRVPRDAAAAVPRREHRQARARGRPVLTPRRPAPMHHK